MMTRWIAGAASLLVAAVAAAAGVVDIDDAELARLMAKGVPVIDIRTPAEWKETGILPGSHPLMYFDERGRADPQAWIAQASAIAKPGEPVILFCRSGNRSKQAADYLVQKAGYTQVYNARGGILSWSKSGRPLQPAAPAVASCKAKNTC